MNARKLLASAGPRPWWVNGTTAAIEIVNARDESVAMMDLGVSPLDRGAGDAALIVAAVNEYEALLGIRDAAWEAVNMLRQPLASSHDFSVATKLDDALARRDALRADLSAENAEPAPARLEAAGTGSDRKDGTTP